jgi:hypothetical protein
MAKKKYTFEQLNNLLQNLNKLGELKGTDFAIFYAEAKHTLIKIFDDLYEDLSKVRDTESFRAYAKEEELIAKAYMKYDEQGKIKELSNEELESMLKELDVLRSKPEYIDITTAFKAEITKIEAKAKCEVEVDIKQVPYEKLPADITADQIFSIKELIIGDKVVDYSTSAPEAVTEDPNDWEVVEDVKAEEV